MKKKLIALLSAALMAISFTGCGDSIVEDADTEVESDVMFGRHSLDGNYSILVDKETGVCYLEYSRDSVGGYSYYGITVMLNADGTPKIWEEE